MRLQIKKGEWEKPLPAINLSACVAQLGARVLMVDLDPQGNATSGLGLDKNLQPSIYDVLINDMPAAEAITPTEFDNLSMLTSNIELAGAEIEMVSLMAREQILKRALDMVRGSFDFIFIDCPPSLGLLTLNALTAADSLVVPI